jgi:hypothetical protein
MQETKTRICQCRKMVCTVMKNRANKNVGFGDSESLFHGSFLSLVDL